MAAARACCSSAGMRRRSQACAQELGGRSARVDWCAADLATVAGRARWSRPRVAGAAAACNVLVNNAGLGDFGMLDELDDAGDRAAVRRSTPSHRCSSRARCCRTCVQQPHGRDPQHRFGVRQPRLSRVRRLLRHQVRAARLHRGIAARAGRLERRRALLRAARDEDRHERVGRRPHERRAEAWRWIRPQQVAAAACAMLEAGKSRAPCFGWPEKLFVRINALLPRSRRRLAPQAASRHPSARAAAVAERVTQS